MASVPSAATAGPAPGRDVDALVTANLPLVRHVLRSVAAHFPRHADLDELAQAGALGLVEAAHRYDPARGVPFEHWAAVRIRGAMIDAVRSLDTAPRSVRATARRVDSAREELMQALHRAPKDEEIAARLELPVATVQQLLAKVHESLVLSLDAPTGGDEPGDSGTLADTVKQAGPADPSEVVEEAEYRSFVRDALALLPDRLRDVVESYFFGGETSESIAARLGVTTSRVSQMRTQALTMMREAVESQYQSGQDESHPGIAERRQRAYAAAVASRTSYRSRLSDMAGQAYLATSTRAREHG